jgi:hypothetical protein
VNDQAHRAVEKAVDTATSVAEEAARLPWVQSLSRLGFYSKGFIYLVVGAIAVMVAIGVRGAEMADTRGALVAIAEERFGKALLVIFVVGAAAHGIWNILRGCADIDNLGGKWLGVFKRSIGALIGFFYLGMAISALEIVVASRGDGINSQAEETFVGLLLTIPVLGAIYAVIVGIGLIVAGVSEFYSGVSGKFTENYRRWQITGFGWAVISVLGVLSFSVRAVLLAVMGLFFVKAPFDGQPGAIGLDAALLVLLTMPYGRLVVVIAGVGLIAHGALAFYEGRYRRIC